MSRPRVLLADDHKIVLEGLRTILEPDFTLVGTAQDGRQMVEMALELDPDVIVADVSMPLLNGIEAARQLQEKGTRARIVFLTMHPDATYASNAFAAGAAGYVLKHSASDVLVTAIREALRGGIYVSPSLESEGLDTFLDPTRRHVKQAVELTGRQREVLQLLVEGKSAKEIANILDISPRTVEAHKYKMMADLGLETSAELLQYAIKHGIAPGAARA